MNKNKSYNPEDMSERPKRISEIVSHIPRGSARLFLGIAMFVSIGGVSEHQLHWVEKAGDGVNAIGQVKDKAWYGVRRWTSDRSGEFSKFSDPGPQV